VAIRGGAQSGLVIKGILAVDASSIFGAPERR
jgi:hypothetical protein